MAERERREHEDRAHETAAALEQLVEQGERQEGEVHAPDLRVHPPPSPDEGVVLDAEAAVARHERSGGTGERGSCGRHAEPPEGPPDGERKQHQQQPAHQVEGREEVQPEKDGAVERDDGDMREVLVVDEGREAEFHLRRPKIDRVRAARHSLIELSHVHVVVRVVVVARDADGDLG